MVDAYVIVYALNDRESFVDAVDCLHELRKKDLLGTTAAILVANKSDIVRGREVEEEGIRLGHTHEHTHARTHARTHTYI